MKVSDKDDVVGTLYTVFEWLKSQNYLQADKEICSACTVSVIIYREAQ